MTDVPVVNGIIKPLKRGGSPNDPGQVAYWFGAACETGHMTTAKLPVLGSAYVHRRVAEAFVNVWEIIEAQGLGTYVDRGDYGGSYCCRNVRGGSVKSPHSWAIAQDLNVHHLQNGPTEVKSDLSNFRCGSAQVAHSLAMLAPAFEAWGFSWGGRWASYLDPMHFEATEITVKLLEGGVLTEAEQVAVAAAREKVGMTDRPREQKVVLLPDNVLVECKLMPDGRLWVPLRSEPITQHYEVVWHEDQGKAYLKERMNP